MKGRAVGQKHESSLQVLTAAVTVAQAERVAQGSDPDPTSAPADAEGDEVELADPSSEHPSATSDRSPASEASLPWRHVTQVSTVADPAEIKTSHAHVMSVDEQLERLSAHAHWSWHVPNWRRKRCGPELAETKNAQSEIRATVNTSRVSTNKEERGCY